MTPIAKPNKILAMRQGGKKLALIKKKLVNVAQDTLSCQAIESTAVKLIAAAGGKPSFKMVPKYHWATCVNINDGLVHGIPKGKFKLGDLVSIDIGFYYHHYHTDTSVSFIVGKATPKQEQFLAVGRQALKKAINQVRPQKHIKDISFAIQTTIESAGLNVIRTLTGHGIGHELHQPPPIPCFISPAPEMNFRLQPGMALAIEVMYTQGDWPLKLSQDGWTLSTQDGSLAAIFEETVLVTSGKPEVLTAITLNA